MSLRLRLSLLFTFLLGGVLLVFGTLAYSIISTLMVGQIDNRLSQASTQIIAQLRVNESNQFDTRTISVFQPADILLIQVWDTEQHIQYSLPAGLVAPLNESGLHLGKSFYSSQEINGTRVRVLSVPLETQRKPVGYLQVGQSMSIVIETQQSMATVVIFLAVILMALVGAGTWILTGDALSQLSAVTEVAAKITQADDLSRRIPVLSQRKDEVGQLAESFNETLERLERLFNTQRRFMADVSHELRTPLTVIKGEVGLMRLTGSLDDESLHNIEQEVDRLTRLVGDLLLLEQAESGSLPLDMSQVALDEVFLEVFQQMETLAAGKVQLILDQIDQVLVTGDRDRLKQVILNLISNAIQYTSNGGAVHAALTRTATQAVLTVADSGPGIAEQDIPHIFERFYRAERSRKRNKTTGFGLGLSIANWIVTRHNGKIQVDTQIGVGTRFTVLLPLAGTSEQPAVKLEKVK